MNNDIFRPKKQPEQHTIPSRVQREPTSTPKQPIPVSVLPPILALQSEPTRAKKKRRIPRWVLWMFGLLLVVVAAVVSPLVWYTSALQPVAPGDTSKVRVEIKSGSSLSQMGQLLQEKKIIRSSLAFDIYTRLGSSGSSLQAGTYSFSASQSTNDIVSQLIAGHVNHFNLTFLPGATLTDSSDTILDKKTDITSSLLKAGYSQKEIDTALTKTYSHPLLADKPADANLEGYIYGETYKFDSNSTVEQILARTFDEYYKQLTENNIIDLFKTEGLTLYQGITLASIVQREVNSSVDQEKVAQVFLSRYKIDMPLGSDVTYQYAARQLGVAPTPELDSPYNTRKVVGLPPGPIAAPGLSALKAVAHPATTDFLYFLSGDDDVTYFAHTVEEHEANIINHCKVKCSTN